MTSQQHQNQENNSSFEIKVPIFCEWTFEKHLHVNSGMRQSLYNYVSDLAEADKLFDIYLSAPEYYLPGFPGIKYYLSIYMDDEKLWLKFNVDTDYEKYAFDGDFTCTLTDCEPLHVVHSFNDKSDEDIYTRFEIRCCENRCLNCPLCTKKKIVACVEGTLIVKNVGAYQFFENDVSDKINELRWEQNDTKDFVIVTQDQEIRVHKSVLVENSTVFARMFDSDNWKETMENKIVIPEFSYKVIKAAIDGCYGEINNHLTNKEEYLMAFQFADKYDMEKLSEAIKKVIAFNPNNDVEYANFFFQNNAIELINCCIDYIFSCAQYSLPIKDIELLDAQIQTMFFNRVFVSPILKKGPKLEHRCFSYEKD